MYKIQINILQNIMYIFKKYVDCNYLFGFRLYS